MKMTNDDRRRFFRITDAIGVSYTLVNENKDKPDGDAPAAEKSMSVSQVMASHNQELKTALDDLGADHPVAAHAIDALNKKLDTIVSLIGLDSLADGKSAHSIQQASISACGIAFPIDENLPPEAKINLTLFLETSGEQVTAIGRVIDCESLAEEGAYYLRAEFMEMKNADREKLIQHIVQRQGSLLRSLKEQME